jgi:anti-anti-sigma regulatory factor
LPNNHALPSELTIFTVSEVAPTCLTWIDALAADPRSDALMLDANAVTEIDGAGVQLLLSLSNTLAQKQRSLCLLNPSQALSLACKSLGAQKLMDPTEPTR